MPGIHDSLPLHQLSTRGSQFPASRNHVWAEFTQFLKVCIEGREAGMTGSGHLTLSTLEAWVCKNIWELRKEGEEPLIPGELTAPSSLCHHPSRYWGHCSELNRQPLLIWSSNRRARTQTHLNTERNSVISDSDVGWDENKGL